MTLILRATSSLPKTITGAGNVSKSGAGTLTLTDATHTGTTTISGGALQLTIPASIVRGNIVNNAVLILNPTSPSGLIIPNVLSGSGTINKIGSNTATLSGNNTFTGGGIVLSGGVLAYSQDAHLGGNAPVTFSGGTLQYAGLSMIFNNNHDIQVVSGQPIAFDIALSGTNLLLDQSFVFLGTPSSSLIKTGAGTLVLMQGSNYSGGTTISAGTLGVGTLAALGSGSIVNNATLNLNLTTPSLINGQVISGSGSVIKSASGGLTLLSANTYAGTTTITGGNLQAGSAASLGSQGVNGLLLNGGAFGFVGGGTLTRNFVLGAAGSGFVSEIGTLTVSGQLTGTGSLTKTGLATVLLTNTNNTYTGGTVINAGTLGVASVSGLGNVANGGTLLLNLATNATYAGSVSGSGSVEKAGAGTLTLTGNNPFAGNLLLTGGILAYSADTSLGTNASVVFNGGTLRYTGATGIFNPNREIRANSGSPFAFDIAQSATNLMLQRAFVPGSNALVKTGDGTLTLATASNYSGGTTISGGTLAVSLTGSLGTGGVVNNSLLRFLSTAAGDSLIVANPISGIGGVIKSGPGFVSLDGVNSYTAGTIIFDGVLRLTNTGAAGSGAVLNNGELQFNLGSGGTFANNIEGLGSLTLMADANTLILTATNTYSGGTRIVDGTLQVNAGEALGNGAVSTGEGGGSDTLLFNLASDATYANTLTGSGNMTKTGVGNLTLTGSNSFGGVLTLSGGTLSYATNSNLSTGNGDFILNGGTLRYTGITDTFGSNHDLRVNNARSIVFDITQATTNLTIDQAFVLRGAGYDSSLVKAGEGTLTLTMGTFLSGGTTITGGELQVTTGAAMGSGKVVNNAQLNYNLGDNTVYNNAVSGSGQVIKSGGGVLTVGTNNTYTGGTTISGGALRVTGANGAGTGAIINNSSLIFDFVANATVATYSNDISGTGNITKDGGGILTLTRVNTYTGGTTITGGTVNVGAGTMSGSLGTGDVANYDSLAFNVGSSAGSAIIGNRPNSNIVFNNTATAGTAAITNLNDGLLTPLGSTVTFKDTSSAGGATLINTRGSVFDFRNGATAGSATITNGAGGTVRFSDASLLGTAIINNGGALLFTTAPTGDTATVVNSARGTVDLTGLTASGIGIGSLSGSGTVILGSKTLTVGGLNRDDTIGGAISGTGGVTKTGTGVLTLSGNNPFSGGLLVSGGTVSFTTTSALGTDTTDTGVTLAGGGLRYTGASATLTRGVTVTGTGNFEIAQPGTILKDSAYIRGNGNLNKTGAGTLYLFGYNTYTGGTTVSGGTLSFDDNRSLGTGAVTLAGGTLQTVASVFGQVRTLTNPITFAAASGLSTGTVISANEQAPGLTLAGAVTLAGDGALTVTGNTRTTITGAVGEDATPRTLVKAGAGTLELANDNTYTGGTLVRGGTLVVNNAYNRTPLGSGTGAGAVTIANGGILSGTYSLAGPVKINAGGGQEFGNSIGITRVGSLSLDGGANLFFEIGTDGVSSDRVNIDSLLSYGGGGAVNFNLSGEHHVGGTLSGLSEGTFTLMTFGAIDRFTLGSIAAQGLPSGWQSSFALAEPGVTGRRGSLTVTLRQSAVAVPESAALGLLFFGLVCSGGAAVRFARRQVH